MTVIHDSIIEEVKNSEVFSVMADETKDVFFFFFFF